MKDQIVQHFKTQLYLLLCLVFIGLSGCAHQLPAPSKANVFDWNTDRFSFANETIFSYSQERVDAPRPYTRRCFVMVRAATQFKKFARFDPQAAPVSELELAKRVRKIATIPVWQPELAAHERVVIPASKNLFAFSLKHSALIQKEIGAGWPIYFRPGNLSLPTPISRDHQQRTAEELQQLISLGHPAVVWLTRFPSLKINHSVLVYSVRTVPKGNTLEFKVYDPNYLDSPKLLTYDPSKKTFSYEKTFYFKGGPVTARTIYWSHFQ